MTVNEVAHFNLASLLVKETVDLAASAKACPKKDDEYNLMQILCGNSDSFKYVTFKLQHVSYIFINLEELGMTQLFTVCV